MWVALYPQSSKLVGKGKGNAINKQKPQTTEAAESET